MAAPSYLGLLRGNVHFRMLWLGQVVSFFGDWFTTIALLLVAQRLTGSATALAGVLIAKTLPMFLMIPIAGPIIDRFDRRWVLIGSDLARAILVFGLIAAVRLESLPLLYTVLVVLVAFSGLFMPARTAAVPQLMREDAELPVAMALTSGTWSVMLSFGAAAGGVAVQFVGVEGALFIDAGTYLLSAVLLWPLPELPPREAGEEPGKTGFVDGLRYLAERPYLALILIQKGMLAFSSAAIVMIPIYGEELFEQRGPLWVGVLFSARGLGALVGSMGGRRVLGDDPTVYRWSILAGHGVTGLGLLQVASATSIWSAALGFSVAWVGVGLVWTFSVILAQQGSARAYRGRVFSLDFGIFTLTAAGASWAAGALIDQLQWTPREVVGGIAAAMMVPMLLWGMGLWLLRMKDE